MSQSVEEVLACQHSAWYPAFRHCSVPAVSIAAPAAFRAFLLSDGIYLAEGSQALPPRTANAGSDDGSAGAWSSEDEGGEAATAEQAQLDPALEAQIQAAIGELGGTVVPKLNWSCPSDAAWMSSTRTTACTNAAEVALLLKASDKVAHDLTRAFESCPAPPPAPPPCTLTLRKWFAWRPHREFRCFVAAMDLVAVSQRNITECFVGSEAEQEALQEALLEFFEAHIEHRFPATDFTFDVYVTTRGRVVLVDFNPVGGSTSPLLFEWAELPYPRLNCRSPPGAQGREQPAAGSSAPGTAPPEPPEADAAGAQSEAGKSGEGAAGEQAGSCESRREESDKSRTEPLQEGEPGGSGWPGGLLWRVVKEPVSLMAPGSSVFGAPYDLADASEGGALQQLAERVQALSQREE